jgi:GMP synthase (glutamine-hydrolysing)
MARLLLMEGNTKARRERAKSLGLRTASEIYAISLLAHYPALELDIFNAADADGAMPDGRAFADYDGLVITGSALHAYEVDFAVSNQIAMLTEAAQAGLPIFGSCWGLQIAAVAAGGVVRPHHLGREVGIARKIWLTPEGRTHPMFAAKPGVFDAPCVHYDEVTQLPEGATLLASNSHSLVQAAVIPLGRSEVWAVQYHPEYDLLQIAQVFRLYAESLKAEGFFQNDEDATRYREGFEQLAREPGNRALAWQYGLESDVLDDRLRRAEILAWVQYHFGAAV